MKFKIAKERVLYFENRLSEDDALKKAAEKKLSAFGVLNQFTTFLTKPKEEEFEVVYREHRFEPFWHIATKAHYVYDRNSNYQFATSGSEVRSVNVEEDEHEIIDGFLRLPVIEHCKQDLQEETLINGVTGDKNSGLKDYLKLPAVEIKGKQISKTLGKDVVVIPPQARISAIMREMLAKMIQGIQADKIFEEDIEVQAIDLYYVPLFAFQYHWKAKNKSGIVEVNAITGEVKTGERTFKEYLGKAIDRDFLFDLGADAAGMLIPGGSIAVKVAKKYMDGKK